MSSNRIYKMSLNVPQDVPQGVPQDVPQMSPKMSPKMSPNNTFYTDMTNIE